MTQPTDYQQIEAENFSTLKSMAISPLQYRHDREKPRYDSPTFRLGRLFHAMTLEPETVNDRFVVVEKKPSPASGPEWDAYRCGRAVCIPFDYQGTTITSRRGNIYKEAEAYYKQQGVAVLTEKDGDKCREWAAYLDLVGDKDIVTRSEMEQAEAMAHAAWHSDQIRPYLESPDKMVESRMVWTDVETGMKCKGIADLIVGDTLIDLKGWADISPRGLSAAMGRWMTFVQATMYRDGLLANGHDIRNVMVACVEKEAPHDTVLIRISLDELNAGRTVYRGWLRRLKECRETNRWPGMYPEIVEDTVPSWAPGMIDDDEISFED